MSNSGYPPRVFDRNALAIKRARKFSGDFDFLRQRCADDLQDRLSVISRRFNDRYDVACVDESELLNVPEQSKDLVVSNLYLHTINDLPGMLVQIRRTLKPDGLFLAAMFGGETLYELRDVLSQTELALRGGVSPRVFPFADKQQMGALMQRAGFALPVVDSEIITVTYDHIFKLMHDLRGMREGNIISARDKRYVGRDFFAHAGALYADKYAEPDGRIRATFEVIYLCGWAPHESQQKPSPRGSGQVSLTEVL